MVEGAPVRMLHGPGQAVGRPIRVPFVFGTGGPKGESVARELGDGVLTVMPTNGFSWSSLLTFGTVLEPGESFDSSRVMEAAGAGAAVVFHGVYESAAIPGGAKLEDIPGGVQWKTTVEAIPADERHLSIHQGQVEPQIALNFNPV